jgi:hypothetical protein
VKNSCNNTGFPRPVTIFSSAGHTEPTSGHAPLLVAAVLL